MYLPQGTPALTPTRKSTTLPSQPSLPARVPGRKTEGTTSGETTTENDVQVSISISFRSDFATVLRAPCFVYDGKFYTIYDFTIDTTTTSGQPVRFFCLVRTTAATRPAWFSHLYTPSFCARVPVPHLPNPIPSNNDRSTNTLEPATPLSSSEALAMPRTPTTTCTFPTLGCPPLHANSSRHPGTEGTSMDIV